MEDISENLTLTDSESTKKKRKKALIIPDELKTITKGAFDLFIISYSGTISNGAILDAFLKKYPCYGYLRELSRKAMYDIIGAISSRAKHEIQQPIMNLPVLNTPEVTKILFHNFLLSYQPQIRFRECIDDFIRTDRKLEFLTRLHDVDIEKIVGKMREWKEIQEIGVDFCGNVINSSSRVSGSRTELKRCRIPVNFESPLDDRLLSIESTRKQAVPSQDTEDFSGFPEKLYELMDQKKERYEREKLPRPITGESTWIRNRLVDICRTNDDGTITWRKLLEIFVQRYPKLNYLLRMNIFDFQNRYGSVRTLMESTTLMSVDQHRPRRRVFTTKQQNLTEFQCTGHQELTDTNLNDLSPDAYKDIGSLLFSNPGSKSSKNSDCNAPTANFCGLDSEDAIPYNPVPLIASSQELPSCDLDETIDANWSALFESPVMAGRRRSPRFVPVRVSTSPILRRSPRLAKQRERSSYP